MPTSDEEEQDLRRMLNEEFEEEVNNSKNDIFNNNLISFSTPVTQNNALLVMTDGIVKVSQLELDNVVALRTQWEKLQPLKAVEPKHRLAACFEQSAIYMVEHHLPHHLRLTDRQFFEELLQALSNQKSAVNPDLATALINVKFVITDQKDMVTKFYETCVKQVFVKSGKGPESLTDAQNRKVVDHFHGLLKKASERYYQYQALAKTLYSRVNEDRNKWLAKVADPVAWAKHCAELGLNPETHPKTWTFLLWKDSLNFNYDQCHAWLRVAKDIWGIAGKDYLIASESEFSKPPQKRQKTGHDHPVPAVGATTSTTICRGCGRDHATSACFLKDHPDYNNNHQVTFKDSDTGKAMKAIWRGRLSGEIQAALLI